MINLSEGCFLLVLVRWQFYLFKFLFRCDNTLFIIYPYSLIVPAIVISAGCRPVFIYKTPFAIPAMVNTITIFFLTDLVGL
ncbi:MAG: hypothetical protein BBJ57_04155 [Desulfobacterales bacterium PC51MH44]|nr:MAG: hypothetical protein BBJ57_04155 [Desulfobacterales bacterium PC51MH44]